MPVTVSFKHKDKAYRAIYFVHERGHSPLVVFSESDGAKVGLRMDHNKNATVFCEGEEGEFPIGGPCVAVYSAGVLSITANAWPKEAELDRKTLEACARAALDQVEAMAAKLREKDGETSMFPARKTP